jgi:hypothetical protein
MAREMADDEDEKLCEQAFDRDWYLTQNPDVASAGVDPLRHYLEFGAREKRDPSPFFDTAWYLAHNPDVADAGTNPLVHYLRYGRVDGRRPNRLIPANVTPEKRPRLNLRPKAVSPGSQLFTAFWHGAPLTALHWACLRSFAELGHQVHLYTYQNLEVPEGIDILDAGEIIDCQNLFFFKNDSLSTPDIGPFSDVFRFKLLSMRGGWWIDADVLCNRRLFPSCRYAWAIENRTTVGTSQIKLPANDPIARQLYQECSAQFTKMIYREEIGPDLITRIFNECVPPEKFGTTEEFYPIWWLEGFKLWLPQCRREILERAASAYFIPCWASLASYIGIDLNRMPPIGSYLEDMIHRLAPEKCCREQPYSTGDIISLVRVWLKDNEWAIDELRSAPESSAFALVGGAQV